MKKEVIAHKCMECLYATLMRRDKNPIIAECSEKNGERFVANASTLCPLFCKDPGEKPVRQMTHDDLLC